MTEESQQEIVELYEENRPVGIEEEGTDEFHEIDRPWNPESIRVATKTFSLRNMLDAIDEGGLDLAPDFQRLKVWKPVQKAQLIESILLQIPLPAFYFAEEFDGTLRVVDGVQRMTTVYDFVRGGESRSAKFPLVGLEYVADVEGRRFDDLPAQWQRRIHNTQIVANVIDPTTPRPVMYDIFRRINTGGTPLNAQEIRHCMSSARSRDFLKALASTALFAKATNGALSRQRRMIDREVVLRFCAFYTQGPASYEPPIDEFLADATEMLDDPRRLSDADLESIAFHFERGLRNCITVFGAHAFRKWPTWDNNLKPFNRALFESWAVVLSRFSEVEIERVAPKIRALAREDMTTDFNYINSISASTGDRFRVRTRFQVAEEIVDRTGAANADT